MAEKQESQKKVEEKAAAQRVASAQGSTPPPPAPPPSKDEVKAQENAREAAQAASQALAGLSREELVRLNQAVEGALSVKGQEPVVGGPTLEEVTGTLKLVSKDDYPSGLNASSAAKKADVDPTDVLGYAVRQAQNADGEGVGPAYLRVVTSDGAKHVVEL